MAGILHLVELTVLLLPAFRVAVTLSTGQAQVIRNEVMIGALLICGVVILGYLAHGFFRGRSSVLSPSLLWHAMLALAVGGGLWQAQQPGWAILVIVFSGFGIFVALKAINPESRRT